MPNWACGPTEITGTRKSVRAFLERFIFDDEPRTTPGKKYFARSFLNLSREETMQWLTGSYHTKDENEEATTEFYVDYAWSAYSCLIDGYPQTNSDTCITLAEACVEDQVKVRIRTFEPGMFFEEDITCNADGNLQNSCDNPKIAKCTKCGNTQAIASFEDIDEVECYECGEDSLEFYDNERLEENENAT